MDETDKIMELAVNRCINYSRAMVKQIDHVKGINDNLGDIKTLVFAAMVAYYGLEHIDDVYLAFLKTDFIECKEPINEVIQKEYKLPSDVALEFSRHCPGTFYAVDGFKNLKTNKYRFRRCIYISPEVDIMTLVKSVAHQVNHVINSIHNPILKKRGSYGSRMGISFDHFDTRRSEVLLLEEAINKLQRDEIFGEVERFGFYHIEDPGVDAICNALFEGTKDTVETVEDDMMTEVVRPLYQNNCFQSVLIEGRLSGNLIKIRDEFDGIVGAGAYSAFLTSCDGLAKKDLSDSELSKYESDAKTFVKTYMERS